MASGNLKIHTENILPIIKKWLYSDKEIFVRELISNACDAIFKRKTAFPNCPCEDRIDVTIDRNQKTLHFLDTGIGMTAEEVEKYIAQVAFSGAEEFLSHYKESVESQQIIGHFGLGFFSAYMVAKRVDIQTLSCQENAEAVLWSCDTSTTYTIEKAAKKEIGTAITLHLDAESDEFLEETRLREILNRYCSFLPYPIYLNGSRINETDPLWIKAPQECSDFDYLEFYRKLYPLNPDPIFWIHLNIDYPFRTKAILYFPKIAQRPDYNKNETRLFCNRVFVSDSCRDLLPEYLTVLRGAIDSPDLPLNVSRSNLQLDRTIRQLGTHISKKLADRLSQLFQNEKERFTCFWEEIESIIKLGILQDEKFYERCKDFLIWKNIEGDWLTLEQYLEKMGASSRKIYYTSDLSASPLLSSYTARKIPVLRMTSPIDTALLGLLENKLSPSVTFQRVDGSLDSALLDASREKTFLDSEGKTESAKMASFFQNQLKEKVKVEAKSLASNELPAFLLLDEGDRRMRDLMQLSGQKGFSSKPKTLVINTNSPLVSAIYNVKSTELAQDLADQLYELALLGQRELESFALDQFLNRSTRLLETLLNTTHQNQ
jgi:molecular chaperone HtpG